MSKFLYLYRGPVTMDGPPDPEVLAAWNTWIEKTGPALVDVGAPVAPRTAVVDDGSTREPSDQNGYSIVEAPDLEAAKALLDNHPFLREGKGRFAVEIFDVIPM
jgi:hypothetical protein